MKSFIPSSDVKEKDDGDSLVGASIASAKTAETVSAGAPSIKSAATETSLASKTDHELEEELERL
jgi:hypothetical protein